MVLCPPQESKGENSEVEVVVPATVAQGLGIVINAAPACGREDALGLARGFGDDVDNAVYCIGAPNRPTRTAYDFDAIYVLDHDVVDGPEHAAKARSVDAAPVDEHKHIPGKLISQTTDCHGPVAGSVHARDIYAGDET